MAERLPRVHRRGEDLLDELFRRHGESLLLFFAERTLDPLLALELTTATLNACSRRRRRLADPALARYLLRIAEREHGRLLHRGRIGGARPWRARTANGLGPVDLSAAENHVCARRSAAMVRIGELPAIHRQAVTLRLVDGLSFEQIGGRLDVSACTARGRVSRGLRLLLADREHPAEA